MGLSNGTGVGEWGLEVGLRLENWVWQVGTA
jgi:hypothetical protein